MERSTISSPATRRGFVRASVIGTSRAGTEEATSTSPRVGALAALADRSVPISEGVDTIDPETWSDVRLDSKLFPSLPRRAVLNLSDVRETLERVMTVDNTIAAAIVEFEAERAIGTVVRGRALPVDPLVPRICAIARRTVAERVRRRDDPHGASADATLILGPDEAATRTNQDGVLIRSARVCHLVYPVVDSSYAFYVVFLPSSRTQAMVRAQLRKSVLSIAGFRPLLRRSRRVARRA